MPQHSRSIGHCPRCDGPLDRRNLLIRYQRGDGEAMYATCPDCADVVRLERSA